MACWKFSLTTSNQAPLRAALHASCSLKAMDLSQLKHLALPVVLLTLVGCASAPKSSNLVNQPTLEMASVVGNAALGDTIELPANNSLGMDTVVVGRTYFAASGRECRRLSDTNGAPIQRVACKGSDGQWQFARDLRAASAIQSSTQNLASNRSVTQPLVPSAGSTLLINNDGTVSESTSLTDGSESVLIDDVATVSTDIFGKKIDQTLYTESAVDNNESFAVDFASTDSSDIIQRELYANETLWKFAKRTTGNALNWKAIAELNNITDAKTLAPGAQLNIPVALVREGG